MAKWVKASTSYKNMDWLQNIYTEETGPGSGVWRIVGLYASSGIETEFSTGYASAQEAEEAMDALVDQIASDVIRP